MDIVTRSLFWECRRETLYVSDTGIYQRPHIGTNPSHIFHRAGVVLLFFLINKAGQDSKTTVTTDPSKAEQKQLEVLQMLKIYKPNQTTTHPQNHS